VIAGADWSGRCFVRAKAHLLVAEKLMMIATRAS
jgi:hypothetical protein